MSEILIERMRKVVARWGDGVLKEAAALERKIAEAAADALADAMLEADTMGEALAHSGLTEAEEELRAVHTMEGAVNSGGFSQFFEDCGREEVEHARRGCERIGAPHFTEIVVAALAAVPEGEEDDLSEEVTEALNEVDERFYDGYRDIEELLKMRLAYAADHPDEFRLLRG